MSDSDMNGPAVSSAGLQREQRHKSRQRMIIGLVVGDVVCVLLALAIGFWLRFLSPFVVPTATVDWAAYLPQFTLAAALFVGRQFYAGRYSWSGLLASPFMALRAAFFWGMLLALVSLGLKVEPAISRWFVCFSSLALAGLLFAWRALYRNRWIARSARRDAVQRNVLMVGWNAQVPELFKRSVDAEQLYPLKVVTIAGAVVPDLIPEGVDHVPLETDLEAELTAALQARHYDEVILAAGCIGTEGARAVQRVCGQEMIDFSLLPVTINSLTRCLHIESVGGVPLLSQSKRPLERFEYALLKRLFDILGPLLDCFCLPGDRAFLALVYRESPGPVFYRQTRTGRGGKPFQIIKIRSMRLDAEATKGAQWCG